MSDALAITAISMNNDLLKLQAISNNIANVNTPAFKRDLVQIDNFSQRLSSHITAPLPLASITTDFSDGTLNVTGKPLDLAVAGENAFFEVSTGQDIYYTKQGDFALDKFGRLVTSYGFIVNGENGEIRLTNDSPRIDAQGNIYEGNDLIGTLKIVEIPDLTNLNKLGKGLYEYVGTTITAAETVAVRQGFVEANNLSVPNEMVDMAELVKHFNSSQKVIQGYNDMLDEAISVLGNF